MKAFSFSHSPPLPPPPYWLIDKPLLQLQRKQYKTKGENIWELLYLEKISETCLFVT